MAQISVSQQFASTYYVGLNSDFIHLSYTDPIDGVVTKVTFTAQIRLDSGPAGAVYAFKMFYKNSQNGYFGWSNTITNTYQSVSIVLETDDRINNYGHLKGSTGQYYVYISPQTSSSTTRIEVKDAELVIEYTPSYTKCTKPQRTELLFNSGVVTFKWYDAAGGNNNPIIRYRMGYSTSSGGTLSGSKTISTTATSGSTTFTGLTENTTYYFAVRAEGSAGTSYYSTYAWSEGLLIPSHPIVNQDNLITKIDMDNLRSYKGNNPNVVIQYAQINASDGNTYQDNLTAGITPITASWYNES